MDVFFFFYYQVQWEEGCKGRPCAIAAAGLLFCTVVTLVVVFALLKGFVRTAHKTVF